ESRRWLHRPSSDLPGRGLFQEPHRRARAAAWGAGDRRCPGRPRRARVELRGGGPRARPARRGGRVAAGRGLRGLAGGACGPRHPHGRQLHLPPHGRLPRPLPRLAEDEGLRGPRGGPAAPGWPDGLGRGPPLRVHRRGAGHVGARVVGAGPEARAGDRCRDSTVEPQGPPAGFGAAFPTSLAAAPRPFQLAELTAVRRPVSRWSGSQGSARSAALPKGMLFVAGSLADGQEVAGAGAGVLMEWSLGPKPACQGAQVAHDAPIVALAYGPYDNGPLLTADARGLFRVWDYTPRLWCSQQVDTGGCPDPRSLAVAMDPLNRTAYSIAGDGRLFVWRQHGEIEPGPGDH
ncbi:unnamed protein product, partial [Prorocentrum cordatum]